MKEISVILGEHIRHLRQERKWTQEQLAEYANLHPTYINVLESGKKNASIEVVYRIATAFELSLSEFFSDVMELNTKPLRDEDGFLVPTIRSAYPNDSNGRKQQERIEALVRDFSQKLIREICADKNTDKT